MNETQNLVNNLNDKRFIDGWKNGYVLALNEVSKKINELIKIYNMYNKE